MLPCDHRAFRDPGGDGDRRDAYAEPVEAEAVLTCRGAGCGRPSGAGRYVVVGAAVFVERHQKGGVEGLDPVGDEEERMAS